MARLKLTLVLASGARIGPGKAALLESREAQGSIFAVAPAMSMDYKRAWLLVHSLNRAFNRGRRPQQQRLQQHRLAGIGDGTADDSGSPLLNRLVL